MFKSKNNSGSVSPFDQLGMPTQAYVMPGLFDANDQAFAMSEGWFVGYDVEEQIFDILDNLTLTFPTAAQARAYVVKRADQGSGLHERALALCVALTIRNSGKANR